jgi:hypothetical protein
MAPAAPGIEAATVIDDSTVEIRTKAPDPVVLQGLPFLFVMSKAWSERNASADPASGANPTSHANLNANGTGPFKVTGRTPDQQTTLAPHAGWWGKPAHNLTEVTFRPIKADATRLAAIVSGEIDMMFPVAPQDVQRLASTPGVRILTGQGVMTVFFGLDQGRAELLDMPGTGKNPLKHRPLAGIQDARNDVEGDQALGIAALGVDGEGDAGSPEDQLGFVQLRVQGGRRCLGEPGGDANSPISSKAEITADALRCVNERRSANDMPWTSSRSETRRGRPPRRFAASREGGG